MKSALSLSHDKKQPITTWSQLYHCHMRRNNQSQHEVKFIIVTWQETTNHNMKSASSLSHEKKQLIITIWYHADIFIMVICCECQDVKTTLKASMSFCMALSTSICSSCSCLSLSCKAEKSFFHWQLTLFSRNREGTVITVNLALW